MSVREGIGIRVIDFCAGGFVPHKMQIRVNVAQKNGNDDANDEQQNNFHGAFRGME